MTRLASLVVILLALLAWPMAAAAHVPRSQKSVEVALVAAGARWGAALRTRVAAAMIQEAKRADSDAFTLIAIAWHESSMRAATVGDGGRAIGLGQIWYVFGSACRSDTNPHKAPSPACLAYRNSLMDPVTNVHVMASVIISSRKLCRTKTRRKPLFHRWLSLYGGRNHPRRAFRGVWCAQVKTSKGWRDLPWRSDPRFKGIRQIINCRRALIRKRLCHRAVL